MKGKSSFKKGGMFNGAIPIVFELAKDLRRNMTDAELILWQYLRSGIKGLKFRRQHPIGIYIADFYCHKIKLIVEVDGPIHDKKEQKVLDIKRQEDLCNWGYVVFRFTNKELTHSIESVLVKLENIVENLINSQISNSKQKASL